MTSTQYSCFPSNIDLSFYFINSSWTFEETVVLMAYFSAKGKANNDLEYANRLYKFYYDQFCNVFKRNYNEPDFPAKNIQFTEDIESRDKYGIREQYLDFWESTICKEKFISWAKICDISIPKDFFSKLERALEGGKPNGSHGENLEKSSSQTTQHSDLRPNERKELGELKREKEKWDLSIEAAIQAALICKTHAGRITRDELKAKLNSAGFSAKLSRDLPNSTIDKIWAALPNEFRQQSGRPPKEKP